MIAGLQANKDAYNYFASFAGIVAKVYAVASNADSAMPADAVAGAAARAGANVEKCASVEEAADRAIKAFGPSIRILIAGSLYLAGDVLKTHA